jgi:cell division initiation protein
MIAAVKVTPLDVRQKQFSGKLRGIDAKQVEAYLEFLAQELEDLVRENIALKDDLKRRNARIEEYRDREKTLQETMITAQKITDDIKDAAKRSAEVIVSEAELQAEKIVQGAHTRMIQIIDEIGELKRQRTQLTSNLRSMLDAELKLLDVFNEESTQRIPENVEFLAAKVREG